MSAVREIDCTKFSLGNRTIELGLKQAHRLPFLRAAKMTSSLLPGQIFGAPNSTVSDSQSYQLPANQSRLVCAGLRNPFRGLASSPGLCLGSFRQDNAWTQKMHESVQVSGGAIQRRARTTMAWGGTLAAVRLIVQGKHMEVCTVVQYVGYNNTVA